MYFKPRIFISSTIGDKMSLRDKIDKIFTEAGAEVALYEKNLTPSIDANTYRADILQTDFVLFIIDERYGAKTENGISGTEEEFNIVTYNKKPCHVYLKQTEKGADAEKLEKLIKSKGISYYYYKTEEELLERVKSSCFTVAKDICISSLLQQKLDPNLVDKLSVQKDYGNAVYFARMFERVFEIEANSPYNVINSNLLLEVFDQTSQSYLGNKSIFINNKIDELLRNIFVLINKTNAFISKHSTPKPWYQNINFLDGININLTFNDWVTGVDLAPLNSLVDNLRKNYDEFKNYVANIKFEFDLK